MEQKTDESLRESKPRIIHTLMRWFKYDHLPEKLQVASKPFCLLADKLDRQLPPGLEKDFALRKLLESKDCAVRAMV